jgi:hypothetical protein
MAVTGTATGVASTAKKTTTREKLVAKKPTLLARVYVSEVIPLWKSGSVSGLLKKRETEKLTNF